MKKSAAVFLIIISLFFLVAEAHSAFGKPSVPTNVQASDGTYMDKVKVTWGVSATATSYTVYRGTSNTYWAQKTVLGTTTETFFNDTTAVPMKTYYYWVKASNTYGTSGFSASNAGSRSDGRPLAPTSVSASDGTYSDKVQVTWTASLGATSYTVYRSTSSGNWAQKTTLGTTTNTNFYDTTASVGNTYYYWVKASNAYGTSNFSAYDNGKVGSGSPQFRAIGGVSMGAYGAMNIGLGRPDFFNTIASLGGPLDMAYMLKFIEVDMLGNYDNPSIYPNRDTVIDMLQDLTISFGNPVYYNPLSTYYPPGITAQNARVATTLLNFKDGELNPDGSLPVITYEDPAQGDWVEVLLALDSNGNGKRDLGEPILRQFQEPFIDTNGNGMFDPGEPFSDTGLDGVWGTGDYGEGDGEFTYNPNHDNYFAEDPLSRAYSLSFATLQNLNLYLDAGTQDEYQFNINAENFVKTLNDRSLNFRVENGFPKNFPRVSHFNEKRVYVRYPGGHVGFDKENIGLSFEQAKQGIEEAIVVANRFTTLFSFISDHFSGGAFLTTPYELFRYPSRMEVSYFNSSSLNRSMKFGIYLPPGYSRSRTNYYPVLYLLLGYNMSVDGMTNSWIKTVLDGLILTGEIQKMIIVIPDGFNYKNGRGHFFVNQIDQERGDKFKDYFFDLVTFIDTNYKTK